MDRKTIPVTLITGFLGSGKTTLINHILEQKPDLKISVILNEFGDVKLESQFIKQKKGDVIELSNGCMCCVAQYDFTRVIKWILSEKPETEYILIEASGLSDPLPIAGVLSEGELAEHIHLDTIVCVIDGTNFFEMKDKYSTVMIQISNSDIALLSKTSLTNTNETHKIIEFVEKFLPRLKTFEINETLPLELILNTQTVHEISEHTKHDHTHEEVNTLFWKSDKPLDFNKMNMLLRRLPANIVRAKGMLYIKDQNKKLLLQYVGARSEVQESEWETDETPQTALVFIGKDFDIEKLKSDLKSCLA